MPEWQLVAWLARTRRCLAARLFFESSKAAALELAATSHAEWLAGTAACNYMQLQLYGEKLGATMERSETSREEIHEALRGAKVMEESAGVHPLNVWSEARAPSPGRALLSSMYTALG